MNPNGLELKQLPSKTTSIIITEENLKSVLVEYFDAKSFVIVYLNYKVLIGTWESNEFHFYNGETFDNKHIQRLRVFNEDKELLVWRTHTGFKSRLRIDTGGDNTDVVVAKQVLFGTKKGKVHNENFTEITEDRGTSLILPFANLKIDDSQNRICIKTHNYIDYNAVNQATYTDCRFVSFTDNKENLLS